MKPNKFTQTIKRYIAAFVISCFLFIGAIGLLPKSTAAQEITASSTPSAEVARLEIPIDILFPACGNFWSG